ncbi:hypothetical protein FVEN_g5707 [Fusarium venenatum]|uniref:Nucleoside phosphorylase domain-containing protein n=1 Tax=Fusarium venenatum TaxID=56646 RepID=A0A2L2T9L4_9HYPO|nr:uncharacterized protein FVRRES_04134 [Fusarium venenatum]KAG8356556.1 hypothetical protein FVEN_g5707 [Fusarium venenatum]KAH7002911.1 hypothetical protein EDB82DRAFT_469739 [Fusarium venenatum]CEI67622.1 unnamed protein product [Fusarium venenatum]
MDVLDEDYGTTEKANFVFGNNDENTYQLGRIGDHFVVINCPRTGEYGLIKACKTATSMKSTIPCIRYILLVGIGGGTPTTNVDIRLGDVAIGTSAFPYMMSKVMGFRKFKHTGNKETPPAELLRAVTELQRQLRRGTSLEQIMDGMFGQKTKLREIYPRPSEDYLLMGDYFHKDEG